MGEGSFVTVRSLYTSFSHPVQGPTLGPSAEPSRAVYDSLVIKAEAGQTNARLQTLPVSSVDF